MRLPPSLRSLQQLSAFRAFTHAHAFVPTILSPFFLPISLAYRSLVAKLLQPILTPPSGAADDAKVEVEILTRTKDEAENKALFERIVEVIGDGVSGLNELILSSAPS